MWGGGRQLPGEESLAGTREKRWQGEALAGQARPAAVQGMGQVEEGTWPRGLHGAEESTAERVSETWYRPSLGVGQEEIARGEHNSGAITCPPPR